MIIKIAPDLFCKTKIDYVTLVLDLRVDLNPGSSQQMYVY